MLAAAVSITLVTTLAVTKMTAKLDGLFYDSMLKVTERPPPVGIVIIAIDDRSLAAIGRWPWPRSVHADLLKRLSQAPPLAVLYDVLFLEPDPPHDPLLAAAMGPPNHVYIPLLISVPGPNGAGYQVTYPVAPVAAAAAGIGQVNIHPDSDGVVRRAFLSETDGPRDWRHLVSLLVQGSPRRREATVVGGPLRRADEMLIPYAGPAGRMRTISAIDLLRGQVPADFTRGKIVLVGATAAGLADRFPTPVGAPANDMSGVEIQANMLDGLMTGATIRPAGLGLTILLSLAPLAVVLAGFLLLGPRSNIWLAAAAVISTLAVSAASMAWLHLWFPPGAALSGLALAYPVWGWRRLEASSAYMVEELRRLQLEPALMDQPPLAAGPGDVVEKQVRLMREAVARVRDLRRFATDALRGLPDATFVVSAAGEVLMRSDATASLLAAVGLSAWPVGIEDIMGRMLPVEAGHAESLRLGAAGETLAGARGGGVFQVGQSPIHSHEGELLGWIVRFTDMTAVRTAQDQREEVLQLLTHDMRSPQTSILALIEPTQSAVLTAETASRIRALAHRTLGLADGFVQLARAEVAPLDRQGLDLADVMTEAADELWPQASAAGVRLESAGIEDEHLIDADRGLVFRALVNLIGNAVRHTPPGGRVLCSLVAGPTEVVCNVDDDGPGLEPAQLAQLFQKFGGVRPTAGGGGIGLGLALVSTVAQRHGGRVTCESRPGQGARFSLAFPRSTGAAS